MGVDEDKRLRSLRYEYVGTSRPTDIDIQRVEDEHMQINHSTWMVFRLARLTSPKKHCKPKTY